ncbi:jg20301 [Pararge aegeria aegeria]|uniref:Jg20301 protein n=1 Tax=Pararge aegeria aegeria TaxID=348720 RepID=A0A8S4RI73_9NEOP|nr:jg20301 [Pararge aegeria aegeria]
MLNRAKSYFASKHILQLYKAQVRPHMEYCSHLWAGAPLYQLIPFDRIQKRVVRLVVNPKLTSSLESLGHRRDVSSFCVFYRLYNADCSEELFTLIPPSQFYDRTLRCRNQFHPHHLDAWYSSTIRNTRSFLPRTCILWNNLPSDGFPPKYNLGLFKGRINKFLKNRQRIGGSSGAADVYGRW